MLPNLSDKVLAPRSTDNVGAPARDCCWTSPPNTQHGGHPQLPIRVGGQGDGHQVVLLSEGKKKSRLKRRVMTRLAQTSQQCRHCFQPMCPVCHLSLWCKPPPCHHLCGQYLPVAYLLIPSHRALSPPPQPGVPVLAFVP